MAKKQSPPPQYKTNVTKVYTGLHNNNNPIDQPRGTHRYALNAVNEAQDGQQTNLSNERGMIIASLLPEGFYPIGDKYLENDQTVVISLNPTTNRQEIGLLDRSGIYTTIVNTGALNLRIDHQCDIRYRLRRGVERVIYWVDGLNKARSFNFNREYDYYDSAYQVYIKGGGDPNTYVGEKWDGLSFDLIKRFKSIPSFTDISIIEVGSIPPGSYNFSFLYVDNDLNPTEWITTSNTVNIYNDTVDAPYHKIRGSRNTDNTIQSFQPANKSIRLTLTNMDTDFPYYRIAIICGTGVTGQPVEVFVSDIQSTSSSTFVYSGNNASLTKTSLEDILIQNEILFAPNHIEQIENRLTLADTRGKGVNWCEFQKFASKISADLALKDVILNSVDSDPNIKNAKSTFLYRGYMPGDVASFGIVYLFDDFTISPAFHVPGISVTSTAVTSMIPYELPDTLYQDIHNCSTNDYWGKDSQDQPLVGTPVRHHRFPFRKDIGAPLFTRTSSTAIIPKYKLTFKVTLLPAQTWPQNPDLTDKVITYKLVYKIGSTGSNIIITKTIIHSQENTDITVYDSTDALGDVSGTPGTMPVAGTIEEVLLIEAGTLSDFITSGVFSISGVYSTYNATTVYNADTSKIYGIQFSNIEKPRADVIGFYIVRNERTEDDKLIVDNAIIGPMLENEQYKAFGLVMPKQYYTVNTVCGDADNCNEACGTRDSGKEITYAKRAVWFFNPEYQFFTKKNSFDSVNIQGRYNETSIDLPTRKPEYDGCTHYRGIYLQDVQAGTSFNSAVNSGADNDGFDMLIGYRNTNINWGDLVFTFPNVERTLYLNASSYQVNNADVIYNVSCDNKIGVLTTSTDVDTEMFYSTPDEINHLMYGALVKDNNSAYSNFISRPYYKEHNNPFLFGASNIVNNISVFNGDAYISPITFNSSVYYDTVFAKRSKKSRVWQIVVGYVLVAAGVVAAVLTAGASSVLSAAAISYGVSLIVAGFKFEQFKNMIDEDYEKGLSDCVTDGAVYECIDRGIETQDDTIRWFGDRVTSMYIESSVPFGLRDGITSGVIDFIDSPTAYEEDVYRNYLIEKLTTIDREQGSGRLYKGYASAEFYSMNPDYMRFNKETIFSHLAVEYDCCSDPEETFSTRVWWSEQSFQEERVDNYRVFLPNNYKDIEGEHGSITNLFRMGNALFVHCKEVLWQLPQNIQERVTSEVVSFIGTGEFFNIPPRKIVDDNLGSAGTQHKWGTIKTKYGIIFISEIENKVYILGEKIREISNEGISNWFENSLKSNLSQQFYINLGIGYANDNNPANPAGVGYTATFDTRHNRYIVTKRDYLYLGDFSKIIKDFDPSETYTIGQIIIDENGFEEILNIQFNAPVIIPTTGWVPNNWNVTPTYLEHLITARTVVYKNITALKIKTVYRITYEVYNYLSGSVYLKVGTQEGVSRFGNGIYTETFMIDVEGDKVLSFISNGSLRVRNIQYEEKVFTTLNRPFTDVTRFENKSWTISYSFYSNSWISWHSYLPLYYIHNQNSLYSFMLGSRAIWKHNIEGIFHKFYGINYPFIVEYVPQPSLETKTWEDLTLITKARRWNTTEKEYQDERFITFNKMIAYTDRGSTGEISLVVKDTQANPQNWLFQQLVNTFGTALITRKERNWNINDIRDYIDDPNKPLFSASWAKLQGAYFTDKVVNTSNINANKPWDQIEMLRDKFIVIRLRFDNFEDVNLIFNYALDTESTSNR
jgi:hypothetical protein